MKPVYQPAYVTAQHKHLLTVYMLAIILNIVAILGAIYFSTINALFPALCFALSGICSGIAILMLNVPVRIRLLGTPKAAVEVLPQD